MLVLMGLCQKTYLGYHNMAVMNLLSIKCVCLLLVVQSQSVGKCGTAGPLNKSSFSWSSGASGEFLCCRIGHGIRELEMSHDIVGLFRPHESQ